MSKLITFKRNKIIFGNRECIMLNLRDVTDLANYAQNNDKFMVEKQVNAELN